jgi:hypothetical protein
MPYSRDLRGERASESERDFVVRLAAQQSAQLV